KNVQNSVDDRAKVHLARAPHPALLRQQSDQQYPFPVSRVACIAHPVAPILLAGGFGPSHVVPPRRIANTKESQPGRNHPLDRGPQGFSDFSDFSVASEKPCAARRLEGWSQDADSWPSFETRESKSAIADFDTMSAEVGQARIRCALLRMGSLEANYLRSTGLL